LDVGVHVDEAEPGLSDFSWQDSTKDTFFDERTGFALDNGLVKQGRRTEMGYMGQLKVWDAVPLQECWDNTGWAPIGTRWVDTDKGDADHPDVRCRIIVQETKNSSTIGNGDIAATFAATPPLECLRIICSVVMSQPKEKKHVLRFLDISRAHPHCRIRRLVYIKLPEEDPRSADPMLCGRLNMALYGTRDAGQNFEFEVTEVVTGAGCEQGISSPCVYKVKERELYFFHHGDDFFAGGPEEESQWLVKVLEKKFIVKDRGILGGGEGQV
jgi:hypothetical protein